jgi:hypothetical protein
MSTSFTPSTDLVVAVKVPPVQPLFTTFASDSFVKPGLFTQPVKQLQVNPATFAGAYTEVYTAAPIDLDYDEPNAVTDAELEVLQPGSGVSEIELVVCGGVAATETGRTPTPPSQRTAA